ncbi:MAG: GHKL domain-containing protein [Roseburia sp.]|nr:GHKL domain-containing protein [Roseburia sp.]
MQLQLMNQRASDVAQYNKLVEQQDEEQKILIHDIKNHLQAIYALNENGKYEEANAYLKRLNSMTALTRSYRPTNSQSLNLLLARYLSICEEKGISFRVDCRSADIGYLKLEDITSLFCNLMDNAIEAGEGVPNSHIELRITENRDNTSTIITVINSCRSAPVILPGNRLITTKKNARIHGFGTRSIKLITERYRGNMETFYLEEEKEFHTIILLQPDRNAQKRA